MELRELPPGGREVQLLLGFCSPPGFFLGSLSRHEVRVGGWPAGLPVDSNSRAVLQPCQHYPSSSESGSSSSSLGRQLRPPAGFAEAVLGLQTQLSAGKGGRRESSSSSSGLRFLYLSLSLLFLSVFKSHYMGFCSFGTSSSFQICPGTSRAVTGMLRTWSVDYRDCTNERIQALLVSRGGIRHLPLPLSFFNPVFPPAPQILKRVSCREAHLPRGVSKG